MAARAGTTLVYHRSMCRAIAYLGEPLQLHDLLFEPNNSLVRQTYAPQILSKPSLAGFGMAAWDSSSHRPHEPFIYRTPMVPPFDLNLRGLTEKLCPSSVLAHVRGVPLTGEAIVGPTNLHPFRFPGFALAMAHNGDLARFDEMRFDLLEHVKPGIARCIRGTTDSEWIYALVMSQIADPTIDPSTAEIKKAVEAAMNILRDIRMLRGIEASSSVNLFLCDGNDLIATRFAFDYGRYPDGLPDIGVEFLSLWYTLGSDYGRHDGEWKMVGGSSNATGAMVASEPITQDFSTWVEVPEYSMLFVSQEDGRVRVNVTDLDA